MMLLMIKMREEKEEETYHAFDDKSDIDSKLKNKINVSIDNLLSVKIKSNLYDISPNTKTITIMSQLKNELAFNCNFTLPLQESMLWKPLK